MTTKISLYKKKRYRGNYLYLHSNKKLTIFEVMAYTPEEKQDVLNRVCKYMVEEKAPLREAIQLHDMPNRDTFYEWIKEDANLSDQYARACSDRADAIFDDILNIADEANADYTISEEGKFSVNGENIQRSRLKIDARKWVLSKMNPKKYGEKIHQELEHKGELKIIREIKR